MFWAEGAAVVKAEKGEGKCSELQEVEVGEEGDEAGETAGGGLGAFMEPSPL